MKLYAISDIHLDHKVNRNALEALDPRPDDWLILAGDVSQTERDFHFALKLLTQRFARVLWTPGNHDLWTVPAAGEARKGREKYEHLVSICRDFGALTPEDPFTPWPGEDAGWILAPVFVLYDYSFRPSHVPRHAAVEWAKESGVLCSDEMLLHPTPYHSLSEWCEARCRYTEERLRELPSGASAIIINHFPLREDLVCLPSIPRFSLWCGTRQTEEWHVRYPISVVVYGHLHRRSTTYCDGVRFEEVSLGYPRHWRPERGMASYLREILPGPNGKGAD